VKIKHHDEETDEKPSQIDHDPQHLHADLCRSGSTTNHLSLCRRHHETGVSV